MKELTIRQLHEHMEKLKKRGFKPSLKAKVRTKSVKWTFEN